MIVLGIIGAVVAFGLPRFRNQQNNLKTSARQISALFREVRNEARLKRMTYRVVFRLQDPHAYWVENAAGNILIPSKTQQEELLKMEEKERPPSPFQKATKFIKTEKVLPTGLKILQVETSSQNDPISEGLAYVYFTPEGLSEQTALQMTNERQMTWTLILNPLTGHSDIVERALRLKDLQTE